MITRVRVKNFRSIADVDVSLGPLTVLVGRNGAGKSAFVDVLRFVRDALFSEVTVEAHSSNLEQAITKRNGFKSLRRWSSKDDCDIKISLTVEETDFWGEYSFSIGS